MKNGDIEKALRTLLSMEAEDISQYLGFLETRLKNQTKTPNKIVDEVMVLSPLTVTEGYTKRFVALLEDCIKQDNSVAHHAGGAIRTVSRANLPTYP